MVWELPNTALNVAILGAMGLEDRGKDTVLQPTQIEFRVGLRAADFECMTANIVTPIAITDIRCSTCKPRQKSELEKQNVNEAVPCFSYAFTTFTSSVKPSNSNVVASATSSTICNEFANTWLQI